MKIVYTGSLEAVEIPSGVLFEHGKPVEVSEELAESLLSQDFSEVKEGKRKGG